MTRLEELKDLRAKVQAGAWDFSPTASARVVFTYKSASADDLGLTARAAFEGSLDAAKALHDAVLPGWSWNLASDASAGVWGPMATCVGYSSTPARAWLIAILESLIAQEKEK